MAERSDNIVKPSALAKELDVHLGTIYGLIKREVVKNYRDEGDTSDMVDRNEVKLALATSRKRGAGARNPAQRGSLKREPAFRARKGDIVASEAQPYRMHANAADGGYQPKGFGKKSIFQIGAVRQLPGSTLVRVHHSSSVESDWEAATLSQRMAQGLARIESPNVLLSMILVQWVRDDKIELAASLESWMDEHDILVDVPNLDSGDPTEEDLLAAEPVEELADEDDEDVASDEDEE